MIVGITAPSVSGERRVPLSPVGVVTLRQAGLEVHAETGVGTAAGFVDREYLEAGVEMVADRAGVIAGSDLLLVLHPPLPGDLDAMRQGTILVGTLAALDSPKIAAELAARRIDAFSLELLPRITRAQPMDVLTSMATIAGYKAALLAAVRLPRMIPMLITAAGTVTPAQILVIGAGVAGLQAIATVRRLGAVASAYDVRPAVREEVESLGARFVDMPLDAGEAEDAGGYAKALGEEFYGRQRELLGAAVASSDAVISTAAVPGRRAPLLITREMLGAMRPGSVVVDLAAESGGNCEATVAGETTMVGDVTVVGAVNLPASVPYHASQMLSRNFTAFLETLVVDGKIAVKSDDEIVSATCLTMAGEVVAPRVLDLLEPPSPGEG